jgi:membrane-associated HD superfamily phosphohydrolase
MEKQLQELLESEVLGAEAREALQEAFSAKLKEAETKLQESYAARFDHERAQLVETMDLMLTDVIRKELSEFAEDKRSVAAQKVRLATALKEADARSQKHVNAQLKLLEAAMTDQIRKEVTEFRTERKAVLAERDALASDMARHKQLVESQVAAKVAKLEQFVLRQLSEEVQEFATDKQALVEQRVKLQRESRTKLQETQQQFMHRATQAVDRTLNRVIREELVQWRADIKQARENNFGRKIFEAVAAEYMSSYLSEGSAVKKMQSEMVQLQAQLQEAHRKISHNQTLLESERRMTQQVREQATRNKVLHELLNPFVVNVAQSWKTCCKTSEPQTLRKRMNATCPL